MQGVVLAALCLVSAAHGIPLLLEASTGAQAAALGAATGFEVDGGDTVLLVLPDELEGGIYDTAEDARPGELEGADLAIMADPEDFYVGAGEDEAGHRGRMALSTEGGEVMFWDVPPSGLQVFPLVDGTGPCSTEGASLTEVLEARRLKEIKGWEARKGREEAKKEREEEARKEREEEDWNRGWVTRLLDSVSSHMAGMPPLERDFA